MKAGWKNRIDERMYFENKKKEISERILKWKLFRTQIQYTSDEHEYRQRLARNQQEHNFGA